MTKNIQLTSREKRSTMARRSTIVFNRSPSSPRTNVKDLFYSNKEDTLVNPEMLDRFLSSNESPSVEIPSSPPKNISRISPSTSPRNSNDSQKSPKSSNTNVRITPNIKVSEPETENSREESGESKKTRSRGFSFGRKNKKTSSNTLKDFKSEAEKYETKVGVNLGPTVKKTVEQESTELNEEQKNKIKKQIEDLSSQIEKTNNKKQAILKNPKKKKIFVKNNSEEKKLFEYEQTINSLSEIKIALEKLLYNKIGNKKLGSPIVKRDPSTRRSTLLETKNSPVKKIESPKTSKFELNLSGLNTTKRDSIGTPTGGSQTERYDSPTKLEILGKRKNSKIKETTLNELPKTSENKKLAESEMKEIKSNEITETGKEENFNKEILMGSHDSLVKLSVPKQIPSKKQVQQKSNKMKLKESATNRSDPVQNAVEILRDFNNSQSIEFEKKLNEAKSDVEKLEKQIESQSKQISLLEEEKITLQKKIKEFEISQETHEKKDSEIKEILRESEIKVISLENQLQKSKEAVESLQEDKKLAELKLESSNLELKELQSKIDNMAKSTEELLKQNKKHEKLHNDLKNKNKGLSFDLKKEQESNKTLRKVMVEQKKESDLVIQEKDKRIEELLLKIENLEKLVSQKNEEPPHIIGPIEQKMPQQNIQIPSPVLPEKHEAIEEDLSFLAFGGHPEIDYFDLLDYSTARTVRKDSQAAKYLSGNMLKVEGLLKEMIFAVLIPSSSSLTKHALKSHEIVKKMMFICITYLSCDLNHLTDVDKTEKKENIQKNISSLFENDLAQICFTFLKEKKDSSFSSLQFQNWQLLMELFLIYEREKTLSLVQKNFLLLFDQLYFDEVAIVVNSFLNSEGIFYIFILFFYFLFYIFYFFIFLFFIFLFFYFLYFCFYFCFYFFFLFLANSPPIYWSKNEEIIPILLDKLYCPPDSSLEQYRLKKLFFIF